MIISGMAEMAAYDYAVWSRRSVHRELNLNLGA